MKYLPGEEENETQTRVDPWTQQRNTSTVSLRRENTLKTIVISISVASLLATLVAAQSPPGNTVSDSGMSARPGSSERRTIATYPAGTILENIAIGRTGDLFVTAMDSGTVFRVSEFGSSRVSGGS